MLMTNAVVQLKVLPASEYYSRILECQGIYSQHARLNDFFSFVFCMYIINPSARLLYIQMELCEKKNLGNYIDDLNTQNVNSPQRAESCLDIVQQIISGVKFIHDKRFIHRDLKVSLFAAVTE